MFKNKITNDYKIILAIVAFFLFILKWILAFSYFPIEDIGLKIIFEIEDSSYLPLIKSLSVLDLRPSYSLNIDNLNLISFPYLSFILFSIFLKILGNYSFIFIEYFSIFFFLLIFFYILKNIGLSKLESVLFSCLLFILPTILHDIANSEIRFFELIDLNFSTFYSLRIPRPMVSNLYFFSFILLMVTLVKNRNFNYSKSVYLGLLLGITLNSFFYLFLFEIFSYFLFLAFNFKKKFFSHIFSNIKFYLRALIIFIFFLIIFLIQMKYGETDFSKRVGLINIDYNKKIVLFDYLFSFFSKKEFILLIFINSIIYFFLINKNNNSLVIFYHVFLSTIFSTTFFIIFSNKGIDYYHFFNWILTTGLLFIIFYFISLWNLFFKKQNFKNYKLINVILIIFIIFYYNLNIFENKNPINENRDTHQKIIQKFMKIDNADIHNKEILTFDHHIFIWLALNDFQNFSLVPNSFWTSKTNNQIENDLISTFKFLNLNSEDFFSFFKNEKKIWRFKNQNVVEFFNRTYLANKVSTFNNSLNFDKSTLELIENTSPIISHQLAIPNEEFARLIDKFKHYKKKISPEIILLNTDKRVINNYKLNKNIYCVYSKVNNYVIYLSRKLFSECSNLD